MGRSRGPRNRQGGRQAGGAGGWWAALNWRDVLSRLARTRQPGWPAVDYKRQRDGETRRPQETDTETEREAAK